MKQESESDNFNIWDKKSFISAKLYDINSNFNFNSQIEKIIIINERYWQVFAEIDIIIDQLSSQKLLQCYQQTQMQKIKQWVIT